MNVVMFSNGNYFVFNNIGEQMLEYQQNPNKLLELLESDKTISCQIGDWRNGIVETNADCLICMLTKFKNFYWEK